jgi:hypothetical protein
VDRRLFQGRGGQASSTALSRDGGSPSGAPSSKGPRLPHATDRAREAASAGSPKARPAAAKFSRKNSYKIPVESDLHSYILCYTMLYNKPALRVRRGRPASLAFGSAGRNPSPRGGRLCFLRRKK